MAVSDTAKPFTAASYPQIQTDASQSLYLTNSFAALQTALRGIISVLQQMDTTKTTLKNAANDAAAATAGVAVNGLYHNAGAVRVRLT